MRLAFPLVCDHLLTLLLEWLLCSACQSYQWTLPACKKQLWSCLPLAALLPRSTLSTIVVAFRCRAAVPRENRFRLVQESAFLLKRGSPSLSPSLSTSLARTHKMRGSCAVCHKNSVHCLGYRTLHQVLPFPPNHTHGGLRQPETLGHGFRLLGGSPTQATATVTSMQQYFGPVRPMLVPQLHINMRVSSDQPALLTICVISNTCPRPRPAQSAT